jgi:cellulose synthase/poly-beta-1,6-N-acetylglucosamine synthase-like glycosyltransferase
MRRNPLVSILIPVKAVNDYVRESVAACRRLSYRRFEVLVLPDEVPRGMKIPGARLVPTGPGGPSMKRDLGARRCRGDILAFLDDDAYPAPTWLTAAVKEFGDPQVGAVGGPAVTPPHDNLRQKASGLVYQSWLVGGPYDFRYVPRPRRLIDDQPSVNLLVRRDVFERIGGYETVYWPGEDTVLCLKIVHELGLKLVYDPKVLVYHHRRELLAGHMRQVLAYGEHRGYFCRKFPKTSMRLSYFLPSLLLLGTSLGWMSGFADPLLFRLWLGGVGLYLALAVLNAWTMAGSNLRLAALVLGGTLATQFGYGWFFLRGLFSRNLQEDSK